MKYKLKSVLEFAKQQIDHFDERYEMLMTKPEDLIGKKVVSIRPGFSGDGGQVMVVTDLKTYEGNPTLHIHLMPCEESSLTERMREGHRGWSIKADEKHNSFIFYVPKEKK